MENLDKNDGLDLRDDERKGPRKLEIASKWMEHELEKTGIELSAEDSKSGLELNFKNV